jgi:hypothetical protein
MALTPRQQRFVELYIESGKLNESYEKAYGVSRESAHANAWRVLRHPEVKKAVEGITQELSEYCSMTREELVDRLIGMIVAKPSDASFDNPLCELVMTKAGPAALFPSKLGAIRELIRLTGMASPEKVEVSTADGLMSEIKKMMGVKKED